MYEYMMVTSDNEREMESHLNRYSKNQWKLHTMSAVYKEEPNGAAIKNFFVATLERIVPYSSYGVKK